MTKPPNEPTGDNGIYNVDRTEEAHASDIAEATVEYYPDQLLKISQELIDREQFGIATVVAHMACEIATERVLSKALTDKGLEYLSLAMSKSLNGYSLLNSPVRVWYTVLTGDHMNKTKPFWGRFIKSACRRNHIMHAGMRATEAQAKESYQAARDLVAYLMK